MNYAGIVKNTRRIDSLINPGRYRIPDELNDSVIGEVKNVAHQSFTQQLRDYSLFAQEENLTFNLYVRESTTLSGALQDAVDAGNIMLSRSLPW